MMTRHGRSFSTVSRVRLKPDPDRAIGMTIAGKFQMTKEAIRESEHYTFQSNWVVFGIIVAYILAFLAIFAVYFVLLVYFGYIDLDDPPSQFPA